MPEGTDLNAYATLLIERFQQPISASPYTADCNGRQPEVTAASVGSGASAPAKRRQLASPGAGRGWLDALHPGVDEQGNAIDVVDPMLAEFQKINARYQGADRVKALLGLSGIFADDLPQNADFVGAVTAAYQQLCGTRCARGVCGCAVITDYPTDLLVNQTDIWLTSFFVLPTCTCQLPVLMV